MKIIVKNKIEQRAVKKVVEALSNTLHSMPTYLGDFVEPDNALEYVAMYHVLDKKLVAIDETEPAIKDQWPDEYKEYEDEYNEG